MTTKQKAKSKGKNATQAFNCSSFSGNCEEMLGKMSKNWDCNTGVSDCCEPNSGQAGMTGCGC